MILPAAVALLDALDPSEPATFRPFIAHCAAAYAEGCCPLCGGHLTPPPFAMSVSGEAGTLPAVGTCWPCEFVYVGPDDRDPAGLDRAELGRIRMMWACAAAAVLARGEDV